LVEAVRTETGSGVVGHRAEPSDRRRARISPVDRPQACGLLDVRGRM